MPVKTLRAADIRYLRAIVDAGAKPHPYPGTPTKVTVDRLHTQGLVRYAASCVVPTAKGRTTLEG